MAEMSLVVVESPAKAKTIKKYLGQGFEVYASVGHVKDLPKSKFGVDIKAGFVPQYETIHGKGKILSEIRRVAKQAKMVYLAPDPDREGEAIAWHLAEELQLPAGRVKRVLFNEITQRAILAAIQNPLDLNENRFYSQQARRILDRLVGYQISPLLWDKVRRGLSAGRVQSVAVRIIVEREREVTAFKPDEFWTIDALLDAKAPPQVKARLHKIGGKKAELASKEEADRVLHAVVGGPFKIGEVTCKDRKQSPPGPFTTSRLQQEAARAFKFTAKRTMGIAQRLYEGVELGKEGAVGLITYMRTDSTRISDDALGEVRAHIQEQYGEAYLPAAPTVYKTKGRAQDAHEAIRPTAMAWPPSTVRQYLKPEEYKLYSLIWNRFLACQMNPAISALTTADIEAPGKHVFRATGKVLKFAGFTRVYEEHRGIDDQPEDEGALPPLEVGQTLHLDKLDAQQRFTQPPPRFTEATLVRELEQQGIGRPSTYAQIISTVQDKAYAEKKEQRFHPTELGVLVTDLLVDSFPQLFDVGFTARMEDDLDRVEEGEVNWRDLLGGFWGGLSASLAAAKDTMRNVKREEIPTDLLCPKDSAKLVIKWGKNGSFLACTSYPDCKFTAEFERGEDGSVRLRESDRVGRACPTCKTGDLLYKTGKFGRFVGCSNYPECRHTEPLSTGVVCPKCKEGTLCEKQSRKGKLFFSCARYPKCDYSQWDRPIAKACKVCEHPWTQQKSLRRGWGPIVCPSCGAEQAEAA
jgi:DNA topoisomerase-1